MKLKELNDLKFLFNPICSFKIGLDFHGVIDKCPELFSFISHSLSDDIEIHIITGNKHDDEIKNKLKEFDIRYDKFFSIYDHLIKYFKPEIDERGNFWFENKMWDAQKGIYCSNNKILYHFDDSLEYEKYFNKYITKYILIEK